MEYELKKTQLTFADTLRIVEDAVSACFDTDENGNDIDFRPECKHISLQSAFCENFLGMEFGGDFDENFAKYMAVDIDSYDTVLSQWYGIVHAVNDKIEYRKQKLLDSQSKQSEMYSMFTTLLSTINDKAKEIDMKKFDKIIKKLNVNELLKAYQKSGIGDGVRDKAIQELVSENKELKNKISAANVVADK